MSGTEVPLRHRRAMSGLLTGLSFVAGDGGTRRFPVPASWLRARRGKPLLHRDLSLGPLERRQAASLDRLGGQAGRAVGQGHWGMSASRPVEEGAVQGLAAGLRGELLRPEEGGYDDEDGPEGIPEPRAEHRADLPDAFARLERAIEAGVLDELLLSHVPVPFGADGRLFDVLPSRIELGVVRVVDTPEATHIRYRVRRPGGVA